MRLSRLTLSNFRCYREPMKVDFDAITALIGKNDAGKSAVLDALDIFLNDGTPDKDDGTKTGYPSQLTIVCEFTDLPATVIIDNAYPTSLQAEGLLNADGRLEIHKRYSGQLGTPKLVSVSAFAVHPSAASASDLLQLKNADLKDRAHDLGVDLSEVDQKINAQLRSSIREHIDDLAPQATLVALDKDHAKDIWKELKAHLPAFALFKSDRPSTDQDAEAQDPLKAAVKEALKTKEAELQAIATHVETEVRKIADKTLEKLKEMDPSLATQLRPEFSPPKWDGLFKAHIIGDDDIPINKRGSGVRRLILLNFFRAKAEQAAHEAGRANVIYAIEEPETSQHPNNQRILFRALTELSVEAQVVISTHTPMLARALPETSLRYIQINEDGTRELLIGGNQTNELLSRALGVLPDNNVKLFIGVEGPNDISFLRNVSAALRAQGVDLPDLEQLELDGEIIFFPLGGSTLALWSSRLAALDRPEFHIYDRDAVPPADPAYQQQVDQVNQRERCIARSTVKKEMENYLHWEAIKEAYESHEISLPIPENFGAFDDVPVLVAEMVHVASGSPTPWAELGDDTKGKKESKAKQMLNREAAARMTQDRLQDIDPDGDTLAWFDDMQNLMAE